MFLLRDRIYKWFYIRLDWQIIEIGLDSVSGLERNFCGIGFRFSEAWLAFSGLDLVGCVQNNYAVLTIQRLPIINSFLHLFDYWRECFDFWPYFFVFRIF
jgi:hypothetical protein